MLTYYGVNPKGWMQSACASRRGRITEGNKLWLSLPDLRRFHTCLVTPPAVPKGDKIKNGRQGVQLETNFPKIGHPTENHVVNACIRWLHANGCFVWRNNTGGFKPETGGFVKFGYKGSSDILGMNPRGAFLAIECKRHGNKQQPSQIEFESRVKSHNGIYVLAYSVDDLEANRGRILG